MTVEDPDSGSGGRTTCSLTDVSDFTLSSVLLFAGAGSSSSAVYLLSTARPLDREQSSQLTATVRCHDGGRPPLSSHATLPVVVLDENDNAPRFARASYSANVRENGTVPRLPILRVSATDPDDGPNADVWYSLADTPAARSVLLQLAVTVITGNGKITVKQTSGYATMVHGRGCNPHLSL